MKKFWSKLAHAFGKLDNFGILGKTVYNYEMV
jgi:hypothetical protein